jgi:uncharacterized protein (TIGR03083 family)
MPGRSDSFVPSRFGFAVDHESLRSEERRERSWAQMLLDTEHLSAELLDDLASVDDDECQRQSLCSDWSVRDIVVHLVVGDSLAAASLQGGKVFGTVTADESWLEGQSRRLVDNHADMSWAEALGRFNTGRARLLEVAAGLSPESLRVPVDWGAKPISAFALVQSRLMETWVHGWDIREPLLMKHIVDDRAWWIADMFVRHIPYALVKNDRQVPHAQLEVELTKTGGGTWSRRLGEEPWRSIALEGDALHWIAWSTRRLRNHIAAPPVNADDDSLVDIRESARCFA